MSGLVNTLPSGFLSLDASRPWLAYWILHSLALLDALPSSEEMHRVVTTLSCFKAVTGEGGFGGGRSQMGHCAPTYSATLALLTVGTGRRAVFDRKGIYSFFMSVKKEGELFHACRRGGRRPRTAASPWPLSIFRLRTAVVSPRRRLCQTYEGGFGAAQRGAGGYTCGLATVILGKKAIQAGTGSRCAGGLLSGKCRLREDFKGGQTSS